MVLDNASFDIQGTTFEENSCAFGSTIQLTSNKGPTSVIKDSTFRKNIGDGLMVIYDSKMDVENTTFEDNISTESTTAIKITHSVFNMKNNRFRNTKWFFACYLWVYSDTEFTDEGSEFSGASADQSGVGLFSDSYVKFKGSKFFNNFASHTASLKLISNTILVVEDVVFDKNNCELEASAIKCEESQLTVKNCTFTNFNSTAIEYENSEERPFDISDS